MANKILESQTGSNDCKSSQPHSILVSRLEHITRIKKPVGPYNMGIYILKVPEYSRQPPSLYTPTTFRFGLHNREDPDITGLEAVKLSLVASYRFADDQDGIKNFYEAVVTDPTSMLICYGLYGIEPKLEDEEIKLLLAFDALYLATKIDMNMEDGERRLCMNEFIGIDEALYLSICKTSKYLIDKDLCKIENQIPFELIKRAIKHVKKLEDPSYEDEGYQANIAANGEQVQDSVSGNQTQLAMLKEGFVKRTMKCVMVHLPPVHGGIDLASRYVAGDGIPYLEQWMRQAVSFGMSAFMKISADYYTDSIAEMRLSESHHILAAGYKAICGVDGMNWTRDDDQEEYIHVPSATKLKEHGIKIVGKAGPLCTMTYVTKAKQLTLPKMNFYDGTESLIRNVARYEEYHRVDNCMFHDYIQLMIDLVATAEDFEYLSTKCGVIANACGSRGFQLWQNIDRNLTQYGSSKLHNDMKEKMNKRCTHRRHRMWYEFKILFLSRPWLTLSAIAAVLITVATVIQTYASVIGTNGMKPHFKP